MKGQINLLSAAALVAAALIFFGAQNPSDGGLVRRPVSAVDYRPWPLPDANRLADRIDQRAEDLQARAYRLDCRDGVCRRVPLDVAPSGQPTPAAGIVARPAETVAASESAGCGGRGVERSVLVRERRGLFPLFGRRRCGG